MPITFPIQSTTLPNGIHCLTSGTGPLLILLPGWPQTASAFAEILPLLSPHCTVYALDPPGLGSSTRSSAGYDTTSISSLLESSIRSIFPKPEKYHLLGHDVGAWIAYAWAAQYPESIASLMLLDAAIPGLSPPLSFPLPYEANLKLWQFSFNTLPDLPEALTAGREAVLFDWLFDSKSVHPERITREKREGYVKSYSQPGAMGCGFAYYRAVGVSAERNGGFKEKKLGMPVLALGGDGAVGGAVEKAMQEVAEKVEGSVVRDCGHYLVEEQPEEVARMVLGFLRRVDGKAE